MFSRQALTRDWGKKSSGTSLPLLECCASPYQLNSLYSLFIQQLWDNIGRILGKFTSFYCPGWRLT
ncbi:hypothetical protein ERCG_01718 [Escherichia coli E1520]|nr:hypothetical protein ERCG_01718 [Escherichia coli E1520]